MSAQKWLNRLRECIFKRVLNHLHEFINSGILYFEIRHCLRFILFIMLLKHRKILTGSYAQVGISRNTCLYTARIDYLFGYVLTSLLLYFDFLPTSNSSTTLLSLAHSDIISCKVFTFRFSNLIIISKVCISIVHMKRI